MSIDFLASHPWYEDHLRPVHAALGDQAGTVFTRTPLRNSNPIVVASGNDLALASHIRRKVALMEHGSGQVYSGVRHRSYAGGNGRGKVSLFVCPSQRVADLNAARYPKASVAVVGSPRVDGLVALSRNPKFSRGPKSPPTVAISFHWRCKVAPEAGTALDHYRLHLGRLRDDLANLGILLVGHAHPRLTQEIQPLYAKAGIEYVASFDEVVARADVFVADNSSTLFEFAALDRPVVLLNSPAYRRDVNHGLRFWDEADVGVQVDEPQHLVGGILAALADPPGQAALRRASVSRIYGGFDDGLAACRAADALLAAFAPAAV